MILVCQDETKLISVNNSNRWEFISSFFTLKTTIDFKEVRSLHTRKTSQNSLILNHDEERIKLLLLMSLCKGQFLLAQ